MYVNACFLSRLDRLDVPPVEGNVTDAIGGATTISSKAEPAAGRQQQQQQQPHQQPAPINSLLLLTSLVDLNVARNKFDTHGADHSLAIFTKAGFPRLCDLDVRGNNLPDEEETRQLLRISTVSEEEAPTVSWCLFHETVIRSCVFLPSPNPVTQASVQLIFR